MKHTPPSRLLIIILIFLSGFSFSNAQMRKPFVLDSVHSASADSVDSFKYTILNLRTIGSGYSDGGKCYIAPLHWTGNDWLKVITLSGIGLAIHQLDAPVNDMAYRNNTPLLKSFSNTFEPIGNVYYVLPAIGGMYLYSRLAGNNELSGLTITAGKAVLIANAFATYAKVLAHRHRPGEDTPSKPNQWDGPRLDLENVSFFSSHTTTAFSLATVIALTYADHKWVPPVVYSMASLVGISRITGHDHWTTDVFVGAVIGYGVGKLVYKLNRSKKIKLVITL